MVLADNRPFTGNANLAEAQLYHRKVGPLRLLQPDGEGRPTRASPIIDEVETPTLETVLEIYVSNLTVEKQMVALLKELRNSFAWDYDEMPSLDRKLKEHRLPIKEGRTSNHREECLLI